MNTTLVIFGATGDLANRLLFPALLRLEALDRLEGVCIIATGREDWTQEQFLARLDEALVDSDGDSRAQARLTERFVYHCIDLTPESIASLAPALSDITIHYLALPPGLFGKAATAIAESGIASKGHHHVVVEKPFGTSGATAAALEEELHKRWTEDQIFRIDHFLGKETVQNVSVMRFANRVVEPLLCADHVDHVQITVAETLGVEGRYRYYDGIGALRDMLQNHLIQLLCVAAMDPPAVWDAEVLRDHKVEVLRAIRRNNDPVDTWAARGQYDAGDVRGAAVAAYSAEPGIDTASTTETFAAVRLHIDNWRWQGVPFYLRSGKRMGTKLAEIAFRFREPPTRLFEHTSLCTAQPNWLIFRLDRPEGIDLEVQTKSPGLEMKASTSRLHADYGTTAQGTTAYQQLLLDVIEGDHTPFMRADEVEWAWRIFDPVLAAWSRGAPAPYASGSDGPATQHSIMLPGHAWRPLPA